MQLRERSSRSEATGAARPWNEAQMGEWGEDEAQMGEWEKKATNKGGSGMNREGERSETQEKPTADRKWKQRQ